jgi:hypothetical protein
MAEATTLTPLATHIMTLIDWDAECDFDLDLDQVLEAFPDVTEVEFERALLRIATELRANGQRLLDQADAFDEMTSEWVERFRTE